MTCHPILMSAPMVRALLEGRKTQTRRVVKFPRWADADSGIEFSGADGGPAMICKDTGCFADVACPYGKPGDSLWVREAFRIEQRGNRQTGEKYNVFVYRADSRMRPEFDPLRYKPSIHMPRLASRITLEITDVCCERLKDISAADCWAEGMPHSPDVDPSHEYHDLWDKINGAGSWDLNPFVWALTFEVIK